MLDAIRAQASIDFLFEGWSRVVDYQFTLDPLSDAGSVMQIGGRFNMGAQISPGTITPFPALYVADSADTALRERFGQSTGPTNGFSPMDFALRTVDSFTQVKLRGRVDFYLDICDAAVLQPFAEIIRSFAIPRHTQVIARRLALKRPPWLVRSPIALQRQLLHKNWRVMPRQFSLPSNSQIFGRLASAAGLQAILYPSAQNSGAKCLALFTQNWRGSASFIEIEGSVPAQIVRARIDGGPAKAGHQ